MAMASIVHQYWRRYPNSKTLTAVIIDHGIRPAAAAAAKITKNQLKKLGIAARIITITSAAPSSGVQAWARQVRYDALWHAAIANDAVIITGHHADDQAEGVQMRLRRNSGLIGLGGMQMRQPFRGVDIFRPFLNVKGAELRQYCLQYGIETVDDASNRDLKFERAQLRRDAKIIAAQGIGCDAFLRLSAASMGITKQMDAHLLPLAKIDRGGWARVNRHNFAALPQTGRQYLIRKIAMMMNAARHPPHHDAAARLGDMLCGLSDSKHTLAGLEWQIKSDQIWIYPEAERRPDAQIVMPGMAVFDRRWAVSIPDKGTLKPLGQSGFAQLRRAYPDHFPSSGVPARAYWRWPIYMPEKMEKKQEKSRILGKSSKDSEITLAEGGFIPHLKGSDLSVDIDQFSSLRMRFNRGDGVQPLIRQTER